MVESARRVADSPRVFRPIVRRAPSWLTAPRALLALLFVVSLGTRVAWLDQPPNALIFDESYYVNAARIILKLPVPEGAPYAGQPVGIDPNSEHPPLGKLFLAGSMRLFGDDAWGWRIPSLLGGMASILLLYGVVRAAGGSAWLGLLGSSIYAFDNLVLVHSRVGTLDMPLLALLLLGAWFYLRGWSIPAGAACALATLVKIGGLYGVFALVVFQVAASGLEFWQSRKSPWPGTRSALLLVGSFLVVWLVAWWGLDRWLTTFTNPIDHLRHILDFGFALSRSAGPANAESDPWQWLLNDVQMPYLRVDQQIKSGDQVLETRATIFFRGAMNPFVIAAAPMATAFAAWRAWKFNDRVALWAVAWVIGTYLPFFPTAMLAHRISYIFYFLPTLPAVAVASGQLFSARGLPRVVLWSYLAAVLIGFIGYYPFRVIPPT